MSVGEITFRRLTEADLPLLHEWIRRPHVRAWWGGGEATDTLEGVRAKYVPRVHPESAVQPFLALQGGEPIGFVQSYVAMACGDGWWADETDPGVHGVDQFLADGDRLGQGLGSAMVAAFMHRLFEDAAVTRVQTDPDPGNARAIRCYEKVGFEVVGRVRTPDGEALLMTIVRDRLR